MSSKTSKRLFINHADQYMGFNIGRFLSQCKVGATGEEEEEEEDEKAKEDRDTAIARPKEGCYQIFATLKNKKAKAPEFVREVMNFETREEFYEHLVECDVIVYDITQDPEQMEEAMWAVTALGSEVDRLESKKVFILISSVMTWAKSKPVDPEEEEVPFTEEEYRRRKPHPNFKEHLNCEKIVLKMGKKNKSRLAAYVVAAGICYGGGENTFHYLFKAAWHNAPTLNVYGNGENFLPTIHVKDLAGVLQNIADSRPKQKYIIATDDSRSSQLELVKAISNALTTGKVKRVTKEEAALMKEVEQSVLDQMMVSLQMEANFVKENMKINWVCETGLVESINAVVKEFKEFRKLQPIRICVLGPPASGKTSIARQLAEHYKLHHLKVKDVVDEALGNLERSAARSNIEKTEEEEEEEEDDGKAEEDAALLEEINENKGENEGRLDNQYINRFFKEKMKSKSVRNQGYVLDGFPKNREQAEELFGPDEEEEEEAEEADNEPKYNKYLMPEYLFILTATDDFLKRRIMSLPESMILGTHNTEEGLLRRLTEYRNLNNEERGVDNYFDEMEIHPVFLDVSKDHKPASGDSVEKIKKEVGDPRNYGPTEVEIETMKRVEAAARIERETADRMEKQRREMEEANNRKVRQDEWNSRLNDVRQEQYSALEAQSLPLRNYLMTHVMPVLTEGLMECCKAKPEDPVDFLAEYIFRHNPQID